MTVQKYKRSKSNVEFFHTAYVLNDRLTQLLLRDFGVKRVSRDLKAFTYAARMTPQDREAFIELSAKYGINVETEYPLWLMEYYRNSILYILNSMINNITQANTIYATSITEFEFRRKYQWMAIGNCYQLLQTMQTAIRNLPVNAEKYMPYVDLIEKELDALKAWKKADNKILSAIKGKLEREANAGTSPSGQTCKPKDCKAE